ncbi:MAG TPA: FAD binding domain-containing protein [Gaiellaceae bacterium]|nr:FAD binding domain-containing protein [Gaiellaceae bacterium]
MIPAAVRYHRASSLEDAVRALAEDDAKALAGGQSLLPVMKLRVARPSLVVDIGHLELGGVALVDGTLRIGALATWDALARAPELAGPGLAALPECARGIGDLQVRNRGTLGGSLAHADPASDMPAVLLALRAELELRSAKGARTMAIADFFRGPFATALGSDELITEVVVPTPPPRSGSAYAAIEHPASGFALAGAAALVLPDGSSRVAATGVAATPIVLGEAADSESALAEIQVFGDRFAPAEYRRALAAVVVRRAVERARERGEEDRA